MMQQKGPKENTVAIIGGGAAGISTAIWCKRLGLIPFLFEANPRIGGALHQVYSPIIDYPGRIEEDGASLINHFEEHLRHLEIDPFTEERVLHLQLGEEKVTVETERRVVETAYAVLATGSKAKRLNIPGEEAMIARGEVYSTHRDKERLKGKRVLIVGGGDRAVEGALNLLPYAEEIYLIHRSDRFRAHPDWVEQVKASRVHLLTHTILRQIIGEEKTEGAYIYDLKQGSERVLPVDAILIRIGNEPVIDLIPPSLYREGFPPIEVDENGRSKHPRLFAVGDLVTNPSYNSISVAAAQGMRAAKAMIEGKGA